MRLSHYLVVVMAGAVLAASTPGQVALGAPEDNTAKVAEAYKNARQLYRQGKYDEAIRAFDEVKALKYHPILDYGIANCYEGLRDYDKAVYYLDQYVRHHPKHEMSSAHPSVQDVQEKIKVLKQRAATGGPGQTGGGTPAHGTPASAGQGDPGDPGDSGDPGGLAGDPVPGPDPYAVPPPPGGGSTGAVYGTPPPPGVHRAMTGPARRSLMVSLDFGAASFTGGGPAGPVSNTSTGGGLFATVLWRFIPWLAVGMHAGITAMDSDYIYAGDRTYFAVAALEARGILPLGPIDLWGSFGIGYGKAAKPLSGTYGTVSVSGASVGGALGMDWFLARTFSLGLLGRIYKLAGTEYCDYNNQCGPITADAGTGVSWYVGMAVTWHYPLIFGRRPR